MTEINDKKLPDFVSEIIETEQKRATRLVGNLTFERWVQAFRERYIVNGFLVPFYVRDGRYSRCRQRISKFGNYILPWKTQGKIIHEVSPGWIRNEGTWFWPYLVFGQEIISSTISIPEMFRIDGIPANLVWQEIVKITKELQLFGENGGGILIPPYNLDENYMASTEKLASWQEGEDGYLEPYELPSTPHWITFFQSYESDLPSLREIEIRPAWFHLTNHAFFNAPVQRLPVFYCIFTTEGKIDKVQFLDDNLSDQARNFIGKAVLNIPIELDKYIGVDARRRERQEMTWWLWRNVGHGERKKTLSYGEIAKIAETQRSSIQTAVERFSRRLKEEIDGKLLERLLRTAISLGLGHNLTYNTLVKQGLAPARKREIDSFDELDKLI